MTVISMLVKVTLVLGVAAVLQVVLASRMSAATRHLVWTLAIVGALLLPALAGSLPDWGAIQYTEPAGASPVFQSIVPVAPALDAVRAVPAAEPGMRWPPLWPSLYLAGVALLLARVVLQHVQTARFVGAATPLVEGRWLELLRECTARLGVRRPVRLLRAAADAMPMAAGVWHACIVLPAAADAWPDDRRRVVLLHELAHVERHDCLTQTLAAIACAVYWMHPGVWWVARRLRAERELASDDRVLSAGENAREYAGHLLELAFALGHSPAPSVAVTMARPRELEGRMRAVLDAARNRAIPALRSRFAGLVTLVTLTVPVAAVTITPRLHDLDQGELRRATRWRDADGAQAAGQGRLQFDVAAIKRTPDDTGPGADFSAQAGGRLHARNNPVMNFIQNAYDVPEYLVVGGPEWIRADRYDLEAKASGEASRAEMMLMMRALLEDRFQLRTHRETREVPAYVMTVARGGARLQSSQKGSCYQVDRSKPNVPPPPGETRRSCGNSNLTSRGATPPNLSWTANYIDSRLVAGTLSTYFRRPVIDRTGLTGFFDIKLELPPLQPVAATDAAAADSSPSVFTVLQEQLGLRVEEGRGPADVLVIDHVGRPTEN
jgi:uncharacterized protein (TIGR03435 family)